MGEIQILCSKWMIIQSELQALLDQQEKLEANNSSVDNMDEDMQG